MVAGAASSSAPGPSSASPQGGARRLRTQRTQQGAALAGDRAEEGSGPQQQGGSPCPRGSPGHTPGPTRAVCLSLSEARPEGLVPVPAQAQETQSPGAGRALLQRTQAMTLRRGPMTSRDMGQCRARDAASGQENPVPVSGPGATSFHTSHWAPRGSHPRGRVGELPRGLAMPCL